jgi:hypothetical protein
MTETSIRTPDLRIAPENRTDILDWIQSQSLDPTGEMTDLNFLNRLVDLDSLPSHDERYSTMGQDVVAHTEWNNDYERGWMLYDERLNLRSGDPDLFLRFLCMMAHPLVQPDHEYAAHLVEIFNEILAFDDIEIIEQSRRFGGIVWTFRNRVSVSSPSIEAVAGHAKFLSLAEVSDQIRRIQSALPEDPAQAIGQAKEMVESVCKGILEARGCTVDEREDVGPLVALVRKELNLMPDQIGEDAKGADAIRRILGNLGQITQSVAELRNHYGTGHGGSPKRGGLQPRHARLVVSSAATLCEFLLDTHLYRPIDDA